MALGLKQVYLIWETLIIIISELGFLTHNLHIRNILTRTSL
jgi:hypothetical protein